MALPKTFTGGERLFAEDLNSNFEALDTRLATAEFDLNAAETDIDNLQASAFVPSGAVFWFAASAAPTGYLECDGADVSRSTYSALFDVVGETFGAGDGSTTFGLPDLRGEFIRGWDNSRGVDAGRAFGSAQEDLFKAHTHYIPGYKDDNPQAFTVDRAPNGDPNNGGPTYSTGGSETRPRNVALLPCIKT